MTAQAHRFSSQELLQAQHIRSIGDINAAKEELQTYLSEMKKKAKETNMDPYELTNVSATNLLECAQYMSSFLWTTESKPNPTADLAFIIMGYNGTMAEADTDNYTSHLKAAKQNGGNQYVLYYSKLRKLVTRILAKVIENNDILHILSVYSK